MRRASTVGDALALRGAGGGAGDDDAETDDDVDVGDAAVLPEPLQVVLGLPDLARLAAIPTSRSLNDLSRLAQDHQVTQKDVVVVFGEMLGRVARGNGVALSASAQRKSVFAGEREPKVSIEWFLWRLVYFINKFPELEPDDFYAAEGGRVDADFSKGRVLPQGQDSDALSRGIRALLLALLYVDRVASEHASFAVSPLSLHRVVLTGMLVALKSSEDVALNTESMAKLGGVKARCMAQMELSFCSLISFRFFVSKSEFDAKAMTLLNMAFDIACARAGAKPASALSAGLSSPP